MTKLGFGAFYICRVFVKVEEGREEGVRRGGRSTFGRKMERFSTLN